MDSNGDVRLLAPSEFKKLKKIELIKLLHDTYAVLDELKKCNNEAVDAFKDHRDAFISLGTAVLECKTKKQLKELQDACEGANKMKSFTPHERSFSINGQKCKGCPNCAGEKSN